MKNKKLIVLALIVLAAGFLLAINLYKGSEEQKLEKLSSSNSSVFVRSYSPSFGENKNKIVLVEFIDPQCEACAYYSKDINKIYKEYYENISLVIRYLANHKNSVFTVKILEASRTQNKFKEVLDVIYTTQNKWAVHGKESPLLLWDLLKVVDGLDIEKLKKDVNSIDVSDILKQDRADAAKLNVRGTPTLFINSKKVDRISYDKVSEVLDEIIYK